MVVGGWWCEWDGVGSLYPDSPNKTIYSDSINGTVLRRSFFTVFPAHPPKTFFFGRTDIKHRERT